ncbi:hypothetical protein DNTS_023961 [Danionella cerebrum]|uniref:A kinase-anchoring proteins AKAP-5 and AKAP-12 calmodulin (CaM)-binding domain-containing protein n=1 Tax=Danionella cerebrum TaxID=2873325 RepID=A0A553MV66_9TELE|nr:hypothetical protein DNTS_023961 [Danionella translucida]
MGIWVECPPSGWNCVKRHRNVENDCHEMGLGVRGLDGLKGHLLDLCQSGLRLEFSLLPTTEYIPLQKNGQISISSLNGKTDDQTDYSVPQEENPPVEEPLEQSCSVRVVQTDTISQREDSPETIEFHQEEVVPQVNGDKGDDSANADEITIAEDKPVEEKHEEANEVGFKKIFRFVGFKFTLKKDKNEKAEPVQLLTVKEAETAEDVAVEEKKESPVSEEDISKEDKSPECTEKEATTEERSETTEEQTEPTMVDAQRKTENASDEATATEEPAEETTTKSEEETEPVVTAELPTSPPSQDTQSPFKRFFTQGIFSNLRKKTSFKKSKDDEPTENAKEDGVVDANNELTEKPETETKDETTNEAISAEKESPQVPTQEGTSEVETVNHSESQATEVAQPVEQVNSCVKADAPDTKTLQPVEDAKTCDKADSSEEVTAEPEILSSQEKSKGQGSPLKKLFTGAGLKKLSSKKHKSKKDAESKQTESSEQAAENTQASTESTEPQKLESGTSSPDDSGEHLVVDVAQAEGAQSVEPDAEAATSDSEKKKEGILPWSSFKKLVTPKKRVKKSSESEDETPAEKPKSSTLSSTESAASDEKTDEPKPNEELGSKDETKGDSDGESKADPKEEKLESKVEAAAEEPKRKMDTSVSWEALICVGSAKKRARKTSDSDDEEPKIEEEVQQSGEEQAKTAESPLVSSGEADHENLASSPEAEEELVSTWESFKRLVTHKKKPKGEDKSDEASGPEQTTSDSEIPKEESSFSLRKLIPRRKKKSDGKKEQVSSDVGSAEDDSDTPAVVPLSEYDSEPSPQVEVKSEEVTQESAPVSQAKASAEERSPSWISTTVENVEDEAEGQQLSDIPEEGDTACTPKSTDNTIAEDIVELTSEAVTALEQVEETEMLSAVSRVTASPVTSGETTPVPNAEEKKIDEVLQETITVSTDTTAIATIETENKATSDSDACLVEAPILVAHDKTEAVVICTGLDTSEIQGVEEEALSQKPSVESVTVVGQVLITELTVEEKIQEPEKVIVTESEVHEAHISGVQTELKDEKLSNEMEEKKHSEEIIETPETETVTNIQEVAPVKIAVSNDVQHGPEFLEETIEAEKTEQVKAAGHVEAIKELICAQTVEVTEVTVAEKVQELEDAKEAVASVELAPVEEVVMAVSEEITSIVPEVSASQTTESKEDPIAPVATTEEWTIIKETVSVASSLPETTESQSADPSCEASNENPSHVLLTDDENIQVVVNNIDVSAHSVVEGTIEVASTNVSVLVEEAIENVKVEVTEVIQASEVTEAEIIEKQSSVIVQEIIQNVVENLSEAQADQKEPEKTTEDIYATSDNVEPEAVPSSTPSTDIISEDKERSPEKPKVSDFICTDAEQTTTATGTTAVIGETVPVQIANEIQVHKEMDATVSVADVHQEAVVESEVEVNQIEVEIHTESEEKRCEVDLELKEVQTQQERHCSESLEAVSEEKSTNISVTGPSQECVLAEQCQMPQEVQIETEEESNAGFVNVKDAVDAPAKDIETIVKDGKSEGQETVEDGHQTNLEVSQGKCSTQDSNVEASTDSCCQHKEATNVALEKTSNAIALEEIENEIEPVSTEVATMS